MSRMPHRCGQVTQQAMNFSFSLQSDTFTGDQRFDEGISSLTQEQDTIRQSPQDF
jgi:hypothetical protein